MARPLNPSEEDVKNFLLGGLTVGVVFAAYKQVSGFQSFALFLVFGLIALFFREVGQRVIAHWMEAEVDSGFSAEGAVTSILIGAFSYISTFNLVWLTPVFSEFSNKSYEHWGKSIDAIWAKRQYWLVSGGFLTLFTGWILSYSLGFENLAEITALFTFFQLLPLDAEKKVCGDLDGTYLIMWSGFIWLIFTGLTIIMMVLSIT
jgi:formate-dependent nitrite reductase membrane component NrfD